MAKNKEAPMSPLVQIALQYLRAGNLPQAEAMLKKMPHDPNALHLLGIICLRQNSHKMAVSHLTKAIRLHSSDAIYYCNLAVAYCALNRMEESAATCAKALALKPDFIEVLSTLGLALREQGKITEAVECFQKALTINPDFTDALSNLGTVFKDQGKLDEAIACFRKALALNPQVSKTHSNLLYAMQYSATLPRSELLAAHRKFSELFEAPIKSQWLPFRRPRDTQKRLKIGYVSGDFRRHAVASFIEPILICHNRTTVEISCYHNNVLHDTFTERIEALADHWIPATALSDEQLAARIREDGIDILVDLSGHTGGNRLLAFARKPAPVQMTYLGYPGTTGLSAMDYRITDGCADTEGSDQYYYEKLLRLPDSLCCYRATPEMPGVSPLPALTNGFLTFGSFNNFNKINQACIALWAQILNALPTARLLLAAVPEGTAQADLTQQFSALGITPERLDFHGKLPAKEFLSLFQKVDVALDPLLITGGTTTCESLWMGVPVIVLIGERFIHRVGYSFLSAAGLSEYAATTLDEYVKIAVALTNQIPQLAQQRASMRERLAVSPLMDEMRFTRNLEQAYRNAWQDWCTNPV